MEVEKLVAQMGDTLSAIHMTMTGLSSLDHGSKLDHIEQRRDTILATLGTSFERESDDLAIQRKKLHDEIAERRRKEDKERGARRRGEDEALAAQESSEDDERHCRFVGETDNFEDEMDTLMDEVEGDADRILVDGQARLAELEEKRRVRHCDPFLGTCCGLILTPIGTKPPHRRATEAASPQSSLA